MVLLFASVNSSFADDGSWISSGAPKSNKKSLEDGSDEESKSEDGEEKEGEKEEEPSKK